MKSYRVSTIKKSRSNPNYEEVCPVSGSIAALNFEEALVFAKKEWPDCEVFIEEIC